MTFNVFNAIKHPHDNDNFFRVDVIEAIMPNQLGPSEPLETNLTHEDPSSCEDKVVREYVKWMDSFGSKRKKYFESLGTSPSQLIPSTEKSHILEEKKLPTHLRYAYLGEASTLLYTNQNLYTNFKTPSSKDYYLKSQVTTPKTCYNQR